MQSQFSANLYALRSSIMPIAMRPSHDGVTNPPALRYRKPRRTRWHHRLIDGYSPRHFTPRGHLRPVTTFGVPAEWTRFHDMLLWSFRGNTAAVHAQLQNICRFNPPIGLDWVRLRLRETASHQLAFLENYLPGEAGTINRVKIRATVLNGGNDFFHEGPTEDDTPESGSSMYYQTPLPPGAPKNWSRKWDIFLYRALTDGESPRDIYRILRKTTRTDLYGLTRSWLELRMAQSGHLGIEVQNPPRNVWPKRDWDGLAGIGGYAEKWMEEADRRLFS